MEIGESLAVTIWIGSGNRLPSARSSVMAPSASNGPAPSPPGRDVVLDQADIGQLLRTSRAFSMLPAVATARAADRARASSAGDDGGDVGVLAARLAAGDDERLVEPVDAQLHPAVRLGQLLRDDRAAQSRGRRPTGKQRLDGVEQPLGLAGRAGIVLRRAVPTSGATHGTATQLPPSSTKVALPWTRSRSPALLPSCLMPRMPFSVAPSRVAKAVALRPFQEAKSTSWVSFSTVLK